MHALIKKNKKTTYSAFISATTKTISLMMNPFMSYWSCSSDGLKNWAVNEDMRMSAALHSFQSSPSGTSSGRCMSFTSVNLKPTLLSWLERHQSPDTDTRLAFSVNPLLPTGLATASWNYDHVPSIWDEIIISSIFRAQTVLGKCNLWATSIIPVDIRYNLSST